MDGYGLLAPNVLYLGLTATSVSPSSVDPPSGLLEHQISAVNFVPSALTASQLSLSSFPSTLVLLVGWALGGGSDTHGAIHWHQRFVPLALACSVSPWEVLANPQLLSLALGLDVV